MGIFAYISPRFMVNVGKLFHAFLAHVSRILNKNVKGIQGSKVMKYLPFRDLIVLGWFNESLMIFYKVGPKTIYRGEISSVTHFKAI